MSTRWIGLLAALTIIVGLLGAAPQSPAAPKAKNVIVLIADGCGYNQIDAASLYQYGKTGAQPYEAFPTKVAMSTYSVGKGYDPKLAWDDFEYVKKGATDSAAAATAMATGVKSYDAAIGVGPDKQPVPNVMEKAEARGKATGVVTSVQFSHATPAGFVAHNESRNNYSAIAKEMLGTSAADVIMGCGHPWYTNNSERRAEVKSFQYVGDADMWQALEAGTLGADADGDGVADPWALVQTREAFQKLAQGPTPKRVCGVPQVDSTLQQGRSGDAKAGPYAVPFTAGVPTLAEMTAAALNVLDNDPDGFVLMIEGGAVDWAGHGNQSGRVIEEQIDFNDAVQAVIAWVEKHSSWDETLVIVTGDHETGYLTGPEQARTLVNNGKGKLSGMAWNSGSHTNSLLPLFAKGAGATRFLPFATGLDPVRGRYLDNTNIARVIFEMLD